MRAFYLSGLLFTAGLLNNSVVHAKPPVPPESLTAIHSTTETHQQSDVIPPHDNLNAVLWLQQSAEYQALNQQIYQLASQQLPTALEQKWNALAPSDRLTEDTYLAPAIVMDIDETVLDNSPYQARLIQNGLEFSNATWDAWVKEGRAKAIPGAVAFTQAAAKLGITVIYISNRSNELKDITLENLRNVGLSVASDQVFLGLGREIPNCVAKGSEKSCRRQWVGQNHRVLMQFGDQLSDFVEIPNNQMETRQALVEQYQDWLGQRWWILANPTYGAWEPALFNNDWSKSSQQRREIKRQQLDLAQ